MSAQGHYQFVDADGRVVEHPTRLWELAPARYKDQVFRVERLADGREVQHWLGRTAATSAGAGVAGMSHAQREAAFRGELGYSQMVPGAYEPRPRLAAMDVVRMKPSDYFKRQGWISFDTDEHALQFSANDPLVGAERIIWASDFPHPDAKYPGTVKELIENTGQLSEAQKQRVYGENARELYGLPKLARRSGAGR